MLPCRHGLCPSCFERCVDAECSGQCPVEKQRFESEDVIWSTFDKDALLNRKIHCWNTHHGCDAVGAAPKIQEHFNHHCQYHVVSCPNCGQEFTHKDIIPHLNSSSCLVAVEESRNAQGRHTNVSAVAVESVQTFENTLKENSEICWKILAMLSEMRVAEECDASTIKQSQQEIKTLLRELQETKLDMCVERIREMSTDFVSMKTKIDALADNVAAGNGTVGKGLEKVEALIGECKTVGTTSGQALVDMKVDFSKKLDNLEAASKAIFLDLRRESEPLEWTIPDWSKVKEKARHEGHVESEADKPSYFHGYFILPGVRIQTMGGVQKLRMKFQLFKGAYDHLLSWPITKTLYLKVVEPTGQCFKDDIWLDTRKDEFVQYNKPTTPKNDCIWSNGNIEVSKIEEAGCVKDDKVRVRFEIKS